MSRTTLILVSAVACGILWGSGAAWRIGASPPGALAATAASATQSINSPTKTPHEQECGAIQSNGITIAQACPPGTCPCRAGGCSAQCC